MSYNNDNINNDPHAFDPAGPHPGGPRISETGQPGQGGETKTAVAHDPQDVNVLGTGATTYGKTKRTDSPHGLTGGYESNEPHLGGGAEHNKFTSSVGGAGVDIGKPPVGERIVGNVEKATGKVTRDRTMEERGEERKVGVGGTGGEYARSTGVHYPPGDTRTSVGTGPDTGVAKPPMGERILGNVEKVIGKITGSRETAERGEERLTGERFGDESRIQHPPGVGYGADIGTATVKPPIGERVAGTAEKATGKITRDREAVERGDQRKAGEHIGDEGRFHHPHGEGYGVGTGTAAVKPPVGERVAGGAEKATGKVTRDPEAVRHGEERKTQPEYVGYGTGGDYGVGTGAHHHPPGERFGHGVDTTTDTGKPRVGERALGKVEESVGRVTGNPGLAGRGEERKVGVDHFGNAPGQTQYPHGERFGTGTGTDVGTGIGKPPVGERVAGTTEKATGEVTGNRGKVERGEERKTGGDNYGDTFY